jgi:hypothetical protein
VNGRGSAIALALVFWSAVVSAQSPPPGTPVSAPGAPASGSPAPDRVLVDRVAVRFYAPETGGSLRPRFITDRTLAFEARLEAMGEDAFGANAGFQERHLRAALDRHIAEELLSSLSIEGGKESLDLPHIADDFRADLEQRVGGAEPLRAAAAAEGIDSSEVDALLRRHARAAVYVDRNLTPLLRPSDEELREVFRTSPHPFRARKYEDAKTDLGRWYLGERLKAAEAAFLQAARTRIKVVVVAH